MQLDVKDLQLRCPAGAAIINCLVRFPNPLAFPKSGGDPVYNCPPLLNYSTCYVPLIFPINPSPVQLASFENAIVVQLLRPLVTSRQGAEGCSSTVLKCAFIATFSHTPRGLYYSQKAYIRGLSFFFINMRDRVL